MYSELFQKIITDYQNKKTPELTKRDLKITFVDGMAIGITGARRGGKTFRTHQLTNEMDTVSSLQNVCRVQFNDHRIVSISSDKLHAIDDAFYSLYPQKREHETVLFVFDEIHRIKGWEDYILYLLESQNHKVVVTGSTAALLKGQFASQLRGKILPVELFPFSFREFIRHYTIKEDMISSEGQSFLINALQKYLDQGGFPGLLNISRELQAELLKTYWDTMLLRDIIEAHPSDNINIVLLRTFTDALLSRIGCPMTVTKLSENLKESGHNFSINTLYKYLRYLSDAYMINTIDFFSDSERIRSRNYKKVYCIDWALARALNPGTGLDATRALENMVFIELKRRGYTVSYYKTRNGFEIDFVCVKDGKSPELFQVSYSLDDSAVKNRELRAITASAGFLKSASATMITFNDSGTEIIDGVRIIIVPIWKWLLL